MTFHLPYLPPFICPPLSAPPAALETHLSTNSAAMVHCGGGKGRAGTVLACYMCKHGLQKIQAGEEEPPQMTAEESVSLLDS